MTDDLVPFLRTANMATRKQLEQLCAKSAKRIEALTAERDYTEGTNDTLIALNQSLTADNARLRASLTGIKRAAAHRMQNDPKDLHSYYFHTADAALNTGKEVMPFVPIDPANQSDIGPGDQGAVAGAALEEIGQLQARVEDQAREIADLTRQLQGQPRRPQDVATAIRKGDQP
jgi:hypothetical protein